MKNKPVFVFDTNSLVSVLLSPNSTNALALKKAEEIGSIIVSDETLLELSDVLSRPKFDKYVSLERRLEFVDRVAVRYTKIKVNSKISASRDPNDNIFLALAIDAKAAYIVSGDADLLVLNPFEGVRIVTAAEFLKEEI